MQVFAEQAQHGRCLAAETLRIESAFTDLRPYEPRSVGLWIQKLSYSGVCSSVIGPCQERLVASLLLTKLKMDLVKHCIAWHRKWSGTSSGSATLFSASKFGTLAGVITVAVASSRLNEI